jgi:hypothetical protein
MVCPLRRNEGKIAHGGLQHRRMATRRQDCPAGIIQRQRQAKGLAGFYFGDALQDLFGASAD